MRTTIILSLFSAATAVLGEQYTARKLYQLDPGTWIENFAQKGSSWYTRMTRLDSPEVLEVDPTHQHGGPRTIYTFPNATNATGITELSTDNYGVLTLNGPPENAAVSIWTFNTTGESSATPVIENIEGAQILNGLAAFSPSIVFAADSPTGAIYRINLESGTAEKVLSGNGITPGVNGLRYKQPYLYYTNSLNGVFGRIEIDPTSGDLVGSTEVVVRGDILVGADDFALAGWTDAAFVANFQQNTLVRVHIGNGTAEVVVRDIPAPTTATFRLGVLYVGTSGTESDGGASFWSVVVPDQQTV
ncbi:hypothetical protein ASPVEDRAFT_27575 [Aspergillus versicolor CBS 583.65]|uniref:SMP-30/Gluconolactonase/LRE-like region domain-containing protein n=1 Tax=Aspergillus versicolor CBS 583.65 TaxID=1036611 RepID=A0A1L9PH69_ASPVE|nr:uncharacterized protein ASPVEDRAFT_27575 [Aspergillus versicolor CBS 583.65]OJJ00867.1 hypothetical protein ASPVEDRAFT_27575 [Aspergillus versicolor CBS 583.65]